MLHTIKKKKNYNKYLIIINSCSRVKFCRFFYYEVFSNQTFLNILQLILWYAL